ncbi:AEL271Cp [Eremothecium gossypii ATCC 10895]|uniref:AEL271Cp n=1 Tax=Eremothecium gossypii (strain ATCC 10895 / CBS 109.51 / FGSC 9923 / NRRL Y-1056) TaxID=284811 RepID=Q758M6_EREGS|nr:AEL271Cp [Eremothecium gossypii ATCC 10895]AAS52413.2 AEL271Cp [Eremothecium gossypii ATCC 10895]AEY96711.1 FAEL271Cp [Eremothecium gossypii FDAG1]
MEEHTSTAGDANRPAKAYEQMEGEQKLDNDEIALYDRQIRLWGMAAQARMRNTRVLLVNFGALGGEVAKNLVLSGIGSLTILDNRVAAAEDLGSQFLLAEEDLGRLRAEVGAARLRDMNPRVSLAVDARNVTEQPAEYFAGHDLVVATDCSRADLEKINAACRARGVPFYAGGLHGLWGYVFVDLVQFDSTEEKAVTVDAPITALGSVSERREVVTVRREHEEDPRSAREIVTTRNYYRPFSEVLAQGTLAGRLTPRQLRRLLPALPLTLAAFLHGHGNDDVASFEAEVKKMCHQLGSSPSNVPAECTELFLRQIGVELPPVAAVIGGAMAQDIINTMGKRQSPLNNFVVLDGITLDMQIFEL